STSHTSFTLFSLSRLFLLSNSPPPPGFSPLSLHDALPISLSTSGASMNEVTQILNAIQQGDPQAADQLLPLVYDELRRLVCSLRSEEHTSELQSLTNLVCRLLLEKKKTPDATFGCSRPQLL